MKARVEIDKVWGKILEGMRYVRCIHAAGSNCNPIRVGRFKGGVAWSP